MDNTTKFCPHCGTPIKNDAKFCPKCGYALEQAPTPDEQPQPTREQADQSQANEKGAPSDHSFAEVKRFSGNFFSWWLATIRHPSQVIPDANHAFGVAALALEDLLTVLMLVSLGKRLMSLYSSDVSQAVANMININGVLFKAGLILFFLILLGAAIYVSLSYGFRRLIDDQAPLNFWEFTNRFAGITNLVLVFTLITFLLSLITTGANFSSYSLMILFMIPTSVILNLGYIFVIINDVDHPRLDKFYTLLLAEAALAIAFLIFTYIAGSIVGGSVMNFIQSNYSSFMNSF
ncbi:MULTISPECIES: zinc ribbon domain-containing protein [Lactobacillaceae]|uniref:zinc ribbon domain-containing protein n=1 Tax=Lactobacillaceae TaxID=33958 RepID=UPI0014563778|nr:zinc ribbon domain-containing protein [Lactobacillus sp. HBUAS51381]NLR09698.1 zinc ribbon domain-containing protein [Lactobacillus sp. HBUAS51381]